ncbi:hypothetical protein [Acidisoma sp.]
MIASARICDDVDMAPVAGDDAVVATREAVGILATRRRLAE